MKTTSSLRALAVLLLAVLPTPAPAQGLINGGFELYNPQTQFLVGWHVVAGAAEKDYGTTVNGVAGSLLENNKYIPGGFFYASIYGPDPYLSGLPVESYWLYGRGPMTTAEQHFLIPSTTRSLQFRAFNGFGGSGIFVEVNGEVLKQHLKAIIEPGGILGRVADWSVDMTPYAGHEVDLKFTIDSVEGGIDDVRLSTEVVPEPGGILLGATGALALFGIRRISAATSQRRR